MKIDEKLDEMKSELTKVLNECASKSKEEAMNMLGKIGLNNDLAEKLLEAFGYMESAKKTAENVFKTALQSRSGVDFSTDIRKSSDTETRMTRIFNEVHSRCAFAMAIKGIEPNEINDEMLDKLYEEGIREDEITNPVLKTTYHYYSESKAKDAQLTKAAQREKNLTEQLHWVEQNYTNLNDKFKALLTNYEKLQNNFKERFAAAEKNYQAALSQISTLKEKIG